MRKIKFSLSVLFSAVCLGGFSQTTVDIGWDYDGTIKVAPASLTYFSGNENFVYLGTDKEVKVSIGGATAVLKNDDGGLYSPKNIHRYEYFQMGDAGMTDYVEYSLTDASADKSITKVKINGTSSELSNTMFGAILFCNKTTFDTQGITGYAEYDVARCRAGNSGFEVKTIPAGTKSFRLYRKITLGGAGIYKLGGGEFSLGSSKYAIRIGYLSATLSGGANAISSVNNDGKIAVSNEYFDVTGKKVNEDTKGFVIVKTTYTDGSCDTSKSFNE